MDSQTRDKVTKLLEDASKERGLTFVEAKFVPNGERGKTLQVFIDHDYAITREEIQAYTDKVSPLLDSVKGRDDSYRLDISSGGSRRKIPFSDFPKLINRYLDVKLKKDGSLHTRKLREVKGGKAKFLYFVKGAKKKRELSEDERQEVHRGYKA